MVKAKPADKRNQGVYFAGAVAGFVKWSVYDARLKHPGAWSNDPGGMSVRVRIPPVLQIVYEANNAPVSELVDEADSKSEAFGCAGSSPARGTNQVVRSR